MRKYLAGIAAIAACFAVAAPAQADLTASTEQTIVTHYPDYVQDASGQQAALCLSNLGNACGPDAASLADMQDPGPGGDAEAFYWSGLATVDVGAGDVSVAFDVEAATVGPEPGISPVSPGNFQRVQVSGDENLPNGTYTLVTPYGTVHATKTAANADGRWFRVDTAGITTGPIDHFLTQVGAPTGFYGDATPAATTDGATVSAYLPGHDPADIDPVTLLPIPADGIGTDWEITGALVGNPITLPPADNDGDGVPDSSDDCPAVAANTASGCPTPVPPVVTPPEVTPPAQQPQVITRTVVNTVTVPAQVAPVPVQRAVRIQQTDRPGRVTGISIRNGVLRARSPREADIVRLTVRRNGRFVKRITVNVNDNGQRFTRRLTRKAGRYSVTVVAANERRDRLTFGPSVTRNFRVS